MRIVNVNRLVVVLQPVLLHHLEGDHKVFQPGKALPDTGPRSVTEGQAGVAVNLLVFGRVPDPALWDKRVRIPELSNKDGTRPDTPNTKD